MSRQLDAEVAEKIIGETITKPRYLTLKPYSSDIAFAMEVVEHVRQQNQDAEIEMTSHDLTWVVNFAEDKMDGAGWRYLGQGVANSLPEAICHAALASITGKDCDQA